MQEGGRTSSTSGRRRSGGAGGRAGERTDRPAAATLRYAALLDADGERVLVDFPDCPGCRAIAAGTDDVAGVARRALERWLEGCLAANRLPPEPSLAVISRDWFEWIEVSAPLAARLEQSWAEARRTSAPPRARARRSSPKTDR